MKIFATADLHLDDDMKNFKYFEQFLNYAYSHDAGLVAICGDVCGHSYLSEEQKKTHAKCYNAMMHVANMYLEKSARHKYINLSPFQHLCTIPIIAEKILASKRYPSEIKSIAEDYLLILDEIAWLINNIYHIANHHLRKDNTLIIPGNFDMSLEQTVLKELNLHKKAIEINGFKIAGYGGSAFVTPDKKGNISGTPVSGGVPFEITTPFNECSTEHINFKTGCVEQILVSEPRDFLTEEQPDIALLHTPIKGYFDRSAMAEDMHTGSPGLLQYASKGLTKLFISGHIHEDAGISQIETKSLNWPVIINPGPLGDTPMHGTNKILPGGNFVEIEMDDETHNVANVRFYKIRPTSSIFRLNQKISIFKNYVINKWGQLLQLTAI